VGLSHRLKAGSVVLLRYHQEEGRYQIMWARRDGKSSHWQAGLRCLEPDEGLWGVELRCGLDPEGCWQMLKQVLEKF
jgi:hypothetical protein